jgi:ribosomal-protein-alanine N-acetyltransferase
MKWFQRGSASHPFERNDPPSNATTTQTVQIERARPNDLDAIYDIEQLSFNPHWSKNALAHEVNRTRPHSYVFVARLSGEVIGFSIFWAVVDEAHILSFAVHPDYRRRGIGRTMMEGVLDAAKRLGLRTATLEVRVSNTSAIRLYEKMGFRIAAIRRAFYQDNNEDAYVMWLEDIQRRVGA